jgi:hypothetical protein
MGPQAGGLAVQFSVEAEERSDGKRDGKTQSGFFVWGKHA